MDMVVNDDENSIEAKPSTDHFGPSVRIAESYAAVAWSLKLKGFLNLNPSFWS